MRHAHMHSQLVNTALPHPSTKLTNTHHPSPAAGRLLISAKPRDARSAMLWSMSPINKDIQLPKPVRADSAQALMTLHGQLYIRVNDE